MKQTLNSSGKLTRLLFLNGIVKKEIKHLKYSADKVFHDTFTVERAKCLDMDEVLAEQVEAFTSRVLSPSRYCWRQTFACLARRVG